MPARRVGPALLRWRRLRGLTQGAVSDALGVAQSTVSRWERGTLVPEGRERARILRLLAARPGSAADAQLLRLVETSAEPVHLVCDATHALLAASPARARSWARAASDLRGRSLWPHASGGIVAAEAALENCGWYTPQAPEVRVRTEAHATPVLTIAEGTILWTRMPLSDGSFARLVRDA